LGLSEAFERWLYFYLPRHRTVDQGRFVFFQFFDFGLLAGDGSGDF
jgi:hypothetical protein